VPVYSLASLLGYADAGAAEGHWLALCGAGELIGLAFAGLTGYVRVARSEFALLGEAERGRGHVQGVLRWASETCYVLSIPSILAEINRRASRPGAAQEG
jgi:chemotaxis signal transduction protein